MNQVDLSEFLAATRAANDDRRTHLCRLTITDCTVGSAQLSGTVLDQPTLDAVAAELSATAPDIAWDFSTVRVLRHTDPLTLAAYTNMTGFFREPSWLAEQQSQVVNGTRMEVLEEQDRWVLVRLEDGYLGWVYWPYMGTAPSEPASLTHMIGVPVSHLHETPSGESPLVSRLFAATPVDAIIRDNGWAEINMVGGVCGFVPAADLRDLTPLPSVDAQRQQLLDDARQYIGVPYLWGGTTVQGIDCSGFAQLMHRLAGALIPRDADQQYAAGRPVEAPYQAGDLMYFGGSGGHRAISHVGISLGESYDPQGWAMIHSGRSRNGVYIDDIQAVDSLRDSFQEARRFL